MLDNFLAELFSPDAGGGAPSPMQQGMSGADFDPRYDAMARLGGYMRDPGADVMMRNDGDSSLGVSDSVPRAPGDQDTLPPSASPIAYNGPGVPLPRPRPDIESILAGNNSYAAAPAGAPAGGGDVISRLRTLFGNRQPADPAAAAQPQNPDLLTRLAGSTPAADRIKASLAGGFSGGNPAFKGGAFMKGAGGALGGGVAQGNTQAKLDRAASDSALKQSNFERSQSDKEKTTEALRRLYGARESSVVNGKPNNAWNKPPNERWKDAQKLLIDKRKELYGGINPLAPKAEREAQRAQADQELKTFKDQTYRQYGFSPDGQDIAPKGGKTPSSSKVIGDDEGEKSGLYEPSGKMIGSGTMDDPHQPKSQADFDAIKPGSIFINPADGRLLTKKGQKTSALDDMGDEEAA